MITVRAFGLLRLNSGISHLEMEGKSVGEVLSALPGFLDEKEIKNCVVLVNGKTASRRTKLKDGDEISLLSPVAGG